MRILRPSHPSDEQMDYADIIFRIPNKIELICELAKSCYSMKEKWMLEEYWEEYQERKKYPKPVVEIENDDMPF